MRNPLRPFSRWSFLLVAGALLAAGGLAACGGADDAVEEEDLSSSFSKTEIKALKHLGATVMKAGVNFGVYSKNATRVDLVLFDDAETARPSRQLKMERVGDVWNLNVAGVKAGQHYGFVAWGPNWPYAATWQPGKQDGFVADVDAAGNRFNPNKLLVDPYARAWSRGHDFSKGSPASGHKRAESTWGAAARAVVVQSKYIWSSAEARWRSARKSGAQAGHGWNDLVVYEVHPKGFTAAASSGVAHPGTFRGVGEKADYLKDLGVTAVELLPAFQKAADGGYWGYQTLGFFMPELTYAADRRPGGPMDEFKWMVDQLHQHGIEVILDVVYNHTGEGGIWSQLPPGTPAGIQPKDVANLLSFRGLDNAEYYALSNDNQTYWNNTGVGNEARCNNAPMRQLVLDSLRFWVTEMHVDGFRFDLAPVLGEKDRDYNSFDAAHTILATIADEPTLTAYNTRVIAEPWSLYGAFVGGFPSSTANAAAGWYEWNGRFRDWMRAFANFDEWKLNSREGTGDGGFLLTGSHDWFAWNGRRPYHSVNFVSVHDGFTLYDVFSYAQRQNGCGPLNPVCCDAPNGPFCNPNDGEANNRSRAWGDEETKRQLMRGLFTLMAVSHGTPMILGGDEWMRTQLGNNNAYSDGADNSANWFDWGAWAQSQERTRMRDFVKGALKLRKDHAYAFAPANYGAGAPFAWKDDQNRDNTSWTGKHLAIHYWSSSAGPQVEVLINMESSPVTFTLPANVKWGRVLDTQTGFDVPGYFSTSGRSPWKSGNLFVDAPPSASGAYGVPARSVVVLRQQP